jgi:hypothetical protein
MNSMFETKFRSYMQSLTQERPLELQQITQNPSPPPHLSSIGSTVAVPTWYPVDDITGDTPCRLHIPIGRVGNKTNEDGIGVAMPRRVFHNNLMLFACRMQSVDSDKLGDKSTIGILDQTHVNQASHTVTLNKNSEMYRNRSQQDFNKQVKEQTGTARSKIAVYIARAIQAFVKDGKTLIKISYFFK